MYKLQSQRKKYNNIFFIKQVNFMCFLKVIIMQELFSQFLTLIRPEF
mgnify:CR=1 FL=1